MINKQLVRLEGRTYTWQYDASVGPVEESWSWHQSIMRPTDDVILRLNRLFVEKYAEEVAASIDVDADYLRLHDVLRSMGATDVDFKSSALLRLLQMANPAAFAQMRFLDLPASTHSPFNCCVVRDWWFQADSPQALIPTLVVCLGDGPFDKHEFQAFLFRQNVIAFEYPSGLSPLGVSESVDFGSLEYVIVGRNDWSESCIDTLIDIHDGKCLKIYSQEMFTGMLANKRDPFSAGAEVLAAFRAGHPCLTFVSQGWPGWVNSEPYFTRSRKSNRSIGGANWQSESPLSAMGYRVGNSGLPRRERQRILRAAFEGLIPRVNDDEYMSEWGEPKSGQRLKKMADFLAANCRNRKKMVRPPIEAIKDWEEDLEWLRQTFYHGRYTFHWPDTFV